MYNNTNDIELKEVLQSVDPSQPKADPPKAETRYARSG